MKTTHRIYLACCLAVLLFGSRSGQAQESIHFKTGTFVLQPVDINSRNVPVAAYLFYRPGHLLTSAERSELQQQGVEISYSLQGNVYWVKASPSALSKTTSLFFNVDPAYKIAPELSSRSLDNRYRISVVYGLSKSEVEHWAHDQHITILDDRALSYGLLDIEIPSQGFEALLLTPWISYISSIPKDEEVNYRGIHGERGWALISPLGRGLTGNGMTVGIGDGGRVEVHEDLSQDYLDLASFGTSSHATQTSGIVAGAGLIDPFYGGGYAPKAHVILRNFSDILWDAPQYLNDFGLTITNNSYGSALTDCAYFGDYDASSAGLDAMTHDHPSILHVFSSANSGGMTCSPFANSYATIAGGYQPAKNVLTVGAINNFDGIASFSSRGPVDDGRLKPEVVAYGVTRFSTVGTNQYSSNSGTSFSSPATVGVTTLLYERYKQLHTDSVPEAALIKNVICNAADDLGNTGPDYFYGFGRINGDRAASILEDHHYLSLNVDQGNVMTRTFTIPASTASVDVMIMWTDQPSAPYETVTLVNDIDLTIVTPAGDTLKPWILNCTPSGVATSATTGIDRFNNYEQITINSPAAGTYTIVTKGAIIPLGPQKAWVSWDIQMAGVKVQSPNGGEVLKPGNSAVANDRQFIRWDAFGTGTSTFTVEYSTNAGGSWTVLSSAVPASNRYLDWFPPSIISDQLLVRVTASNGMLDVSDHEAVIMAPPTNLLATSPCNGNVQLSWTAIPGISTYKVFEIKNETLIPLGTTASTSYTVRDLPVDSAIWLSVAGALPSGSIGLRARAVLITANGGNGCTWPIDLRLDSMVNLHTGRKFTSTALSASTLLTAHLTNIGNTNASGFTLSYQVNSDMPTTQAFGATLNAGSGVNFQFTKPADFSAVGVYQIKCWINYPSDPFHENDTITLVIRQLDNPVISLPFTEGFESAAEAIILSSQYGLTGNDAVDINVQSTARARTHAGAPFAHDGQRAITVDAVRTGASKSGSCIITRNLSAYHTNTHDIRLSFQVMHHEIIQDASNTEAVWIRGADTLPFILLTMIPDGATSRGVWQRFSGLDLSDVLSAAGQDFSASFQMKFTFDVYATAGQVNSQDGESIDDIALNLIQKDVAVTGITNPPAVACNLGVETIQTTVTNTSNAAVNNVSVNYRINGGAIFSTFVGTVNANAVVPVSLIPTYNFSASGKYLVETWTSSTQDDFPSNDTFRINVLQSTLVSTFPYLEGFENGTGGFKADGTHSSWAYGSPGKTNFSRAAEGKFEWITGVTASHNADELSYLYSPCFDLTGLTLPYLSFALQYQLETSYDFAWVEYRISGSNTWQKLGLQNGGVNWYNHVSNTWNGSQLKWTTAGIAIPVTNTTVQFRWVMQSDVGVELEGLAVDQVHIYDKVAMYNGATVTVVQAVSGNNWVHLTSGGQRIFSIHPMGQNLGNVTLTMYKSASNFQLSDSLYLLSRNWVLSATNPPATGIKMRGYFTNTEATNLANASGCSQCISARDGFDVAALRYTGSNQDGSYSNNTSTQVSAYQLDSTQVAPYDIGYYAEWNAAGMSEWWITSTVTKWAGTYQDRISAGNNDAEEHEFNGAVNPFSEALSMTEKDGKQKLGWRFQHITIPKGSYIESAHLEWTSAATHTAATNWTLQAEMSANASSFSTSKYSLSQRTRSVQALQWAPVSWNAINMTYASPEIKHLLQQIVDQSGWVTGHDLAFIMNGNGLRQAWSYEGDSLKGAKLVVTYQPGCNESGVCYVDINATGTQNGNSWANAYRSLDQALDRTVHCAGIDDIWIADGLYKPYVEVARTNGYTIRSGVHIYGGFQGNETAISQRIYGMYPTIISGDIGTTGLPADNLYHVISVQGGAEQTILDGITIRDGLANGVTLDLQRGSGLYNLGNLKVQKVNLLSCSAPAVYNAPGSALTAFEFLDVKQ